MSVHEKTRRQRRYLAVSWRDDDGRQRWKSFGPADGPGAEDRRRQALAFDHELKARRLRRERLGPLPASTLPTFGELLALYLADRRGQASPRALLEIQKALETYVVPEIGNLSCDAITMEHLLPVRSRMQAAELSTASSNHYLGDAGSVFRFGVAHQIIPFNPWAPWKRGRVADWDVPPPSPEDIAKLIAAAPEHLAWAIEVAYHTGVRCGESELFALKWPDVDWEAGGLWVYGRKTKRLRFVHVKGAFIERMRTRFEARKCEWIICYQGRPLKRGGLKRSWREAKAVAGVDQRLRLYDLRHAHGTQKLAAGADRRSTASGMGHHSLQMLDRYCHPVNEASRRSAEKLPDPPALPTDVTAAIEERRAKRKAARKNRTASNS